MRKPKPNKRVTPRSTTFKRIAKALRVRATNYSRQATAAKKAKDDQLFYYWTGRAATLRDITAELDNEAATLRAMD